MTLLPKLSLACDSATHLILAATASTVAARDQPFFDDLLFDAWRRGDCVRCVVADAGYDSEDNLRIARLDMNVRAIIPPRAGRPTDKLPPPRTLRRRMRQRLQRPAERKLYGQRWQSETVNSMIKRNLGSALRARTTVHRRHELLLRVLTHNIMLLAEG